MVTREKAALEISRQDLLAYSCALWLRRQAGGSVTLLAMSSANAVECLEPLYAYGADRIVLLSNPLLAGSDTVATSYALASWIRNEGHYELILSGCQSSDSETGQVPASLAESLGMPCYANVVEISLGQQGCFLLKRELERYFVKTGSLRSGTLTIKNWAENGPPKTAQILENHKRLNCSRCSPVMLLWWGLRDRKPGMPAEETGKRIPSGRRNCTG